ncbi:hypothetical protein LWI28_026917 [Acer negundo]|uniref:Uncharacterized protein n=1 Tax=Acer negundo TaxID=4023 RepID=A0AAD5NWT9_ACENE|nr:hypothetical protein LWI28_026917 [Acer negundo]
MPTFNDNRSKTFYLLNINIAELSSGLLSKQLLNLLSRSVNPAQRKKEKIHMIPPSKCRMSMGKQMSFNFSRLSFSFNFHCTTQPVIEVDKPNIKEEKEYGTNPPSKWSTRTLSSGMRKKHTHELAAEMDYEDAAEKKENVEEEEDDPEEA